MSNFRETQFFRADKWAEETATELRSLANQIDAERRRMAQAAEADNVVEVGSRLAQMVHTLTWGLANMHIERPTQIAADLCYRELDAAN